MLREDITRALTDAMKARDADTVSTYRMLTSAIRREEIDGQKTIDDSGVEQVIRRQVKQLIDALNDFRTGKRSDLIQKTEKEIALLQRFLPAELSTEELTIIVDRVVTELGTPTKNDIGRVMAAVMKEVKGRADGNRVRDLVSQKLS